MASNIKSRVNRHTVTKTLIHIREFLNTYKISDLGIIIFAGVNEYDETIFEALVPKRKFKGLVYSCSSKFKIDELEEYLTEDKHSGLIIFANGNETYIYEWIGSEFRRIKKLEGLLIKRMSKGGQSSVRFSRLAEESRAVYITRIIDAIPRSFLLERNIHLFGSDEICSMLVESIPIIREGFLEFNNETILDTRKWLSYLSPSDEQYEIQLANIVLYLDTDPDRLDFDIESKNSMEYYVSSIQDVSNKCVPLSLKSKSYARLSIFTYIGVKYFSSPSAEQD
jgi:hypothetical protein